MPANWNIIVSTARSDAHFDHPDLPLPIAIRQVRGARSLRLRYDSARQLLKLTCPPRTSRSAALRWAGEQRAWVDAQLAATPPAEPFRPGARILFEGREIMLDWSPRTPRRAMLKDDILTCGGPIEGFARRVESHLRTVARDTLSDETAACAAIAGVTISGVSLGDADTRWGSCSARGRIRYNWRLILAPPAVRRWVVAHEVAHRRHMNHGAGFKALEAELFDGDVAAARSLLRRLGPRLKRIGRG
jgi:predicted metal-dependent hydrolase